MDALGKTPFREAADCLVSDCGKRYPLLGAAVYDLRFLREATVATDLRAWRKGQDGYEARIVPPDRSQKAPYPPL